MNEVILRINETHPEIRIEMYADDGLLSSPSETSLTKFVNDFENLLTTYGIRISPAKSGWVRQGGKWLKPLKYLGLTYDGDQDSLRASTRNGATTPISIHLLEILNYICYWLGLIETTSKSELERRRESLPTTNPIIHKIMYNYYTSLLTIKSDRLGLPKGLSLSWFVGLINLLENYGFWDKSWVYRIFEYGLYTFSPGIDLTKWQAYQTSKSFEEDELLREMLDEKERQGHSGSLSISHMPASSFTGGEILDIDPKLHQLDHSIVWSQNVPISSTTLHFTSGNLLTEDSISTILTDYQTIPSLVDVIRAAIGETYDRLAPYLSGNFFRVLSGLHGLPDLFLPRHELKGLNMTHLVHKHWKANLANSPYFGAILSLAYNNLPLTSLSTPSNPQDFSLTHKSTSPAADLVVHVSGATVFNGTSYFVKDILSYLRDPRGYVPYKLGACPNPWLIELEPKQPPGADLEEGKR